MGAGNVKAAKPQPPPLRLPVDAHHHAPRELLHPSKPVHHIADLVPLPAVVKSPVSKAWQVTCNVHRGIICRFCGGKSCKREDFTKQPDTPAIHGLHSTWVSANVLGMQRPSSRLIKQYNIIDQFKKAGVGAIVNLQLAGEHPYCGDGIDAAGFSYRAEEFTDHGILHYNPGWVDMDIPTLERMIEITQFMQFHTDKSQKVAVHCLAEEMQLLTNRGFVGIADVEAYASLSLVHRAQNPLLFATYNESRDQLEYQEATHFVFNAAGAEMVEFTHSNEQRCWDAASDKYGRTPAQVSRAAKQSLKNQTSNAMNSASEGEEIAAAERNEDSSHPSNGVSLLVTFNHDMFVQEGKRVGGGQLGTRWKMRIARDEEGEPLRRARGRKEEEEIVPPSKVRADQLLSDDVNRRLKLTGFAEKGVRIPLPEDAGGDSRAWRMPFVARLKLADSNTVRTAFLEIYGYWLGDGSMGYQSNAVRFHIMKPHDIKWLKEMLEKVGLKEQTDFCIDDLADGSRTICVTKQEWFDYFHAQYGCQYPEGRRRLALTEDIGGTDSSESDSESRSSEESHMTALDAPVPAAVPAPSVNRLSSEQVQRFAEIENVARRIGGAGAAAARSSSTSTPANVEAPPRADAVKSGKWFWYWVWRLEKPALRSILSGLRRADGDEADEANEAHLISTSSVSFRDELVRVVSHAGYASFIRLGYTKGSHRGYSVRDGAPIIATADSWRVSYSDQSQYGGPTLHNATDIRRVSGYTGRNWCVTVPNGLVVTRRVHVDEGGIVTKASKPIIIGNCHAGYGRTGITIACFFVLAYGLAPETAIKSVRDRRPGSVQTAKQRKFVTEFAEYVNYLRTVYYPPVMTPFAMRVAKASAHAPGAGSPHNAAAAAVIAGLVDSSDDDEDLGGGGAGVDGLDEDEEGFSNGMMDGNGGGAGGAGGHQHGGGGGGGGGGQDGNGRSPHFPPGGTLTTAASGYPGLSLSRKHAAILTAITNEKKAQETHRYTLHEALSRQRAILHGEERNALKFVPMIVHLLSTRLLDICEHNPSLAAAAFLDGFRKVPLLSMHGLPPHCATLGRAFEEELAREKQRRKDEREHQRRSQNQQRPFGGGGGAGGEDSILPGQVGGGEDGEKLSLPGQVPDVSPEVSRAAGNGGGVEPSSRNQEDSRHHGQRSRQYPSGSKQQKASRGLVDVGDGLLATLSTHGALSGSHHGWWEFPSAYGNRHHHHHHHHPYAQAHVSHEADDAGSRWTPIQADTFSDLKKSINAGEYKVLEQCDMRYCAQLLLEWLDTLKTPLLPLFERATPTQAHSSGAGGSISADANGRSGTGGPNGAPHPGKAQPPSQAYANHHSPHHPLMTPSALFAALPKWTLATLDRVLTMLYHMRTLEVGALVRVYLRFSFALTHPRCVLPEPLQVHRTAALRTQGALGQRAQLAGLTVQVLNHAAQAQLIHAQQTLTSPLSSAAAKTAALTVLRSPPHCFDPLWNVLPASRPLLDGLVEFLAAFVRGWGGSYRRVLREQEQTSGRIGIRRPISQYAEGGAGGAGGRNEPSYAQASNGLRSYGAAGGDRMRDLWSSEMEPAGLHSHRKDDGASSQRRRNHHDGAREMTEKGMLEAVVDNADTGLMRRREQLRAPEQTQELSHLGSRAEVSTTAYLHSRIHRDAPRDISVHAPNGVGSAGATGSPQHVGGGMRERGTRNRRSDGMSIGTSNDLLVSDQPFSSPSNLPRSLGQSGSSSNLAELGGGFSSGGSGALPAELPAVAAAAFEASYLASSDGVLGDADQAERLAGFLTSRGRAAQSGGGSMVNEDGLGEQSIDGLEHYDEPHTAPVMDRPDRHMAGLTVQTNGSHRSNENSLQLPPISPAAGEPNSAPVPSTHAVVSPPPPSSSVVSLPSLTLPPLLHPLATPAPSPAVDHPVMRPRVVIVRNPAGPATPVITGSAVTVADSNAEE